MASAVNGVTDSWANAAGLQFRRVCWHAPKQSDTLVIFVHGLGEHAGRYDRYAAHLESLGAHVWGYDHRGHGLSGGRMGDADGLGQLADDLGELTAALLAETGATTLVYIAHSMGSAVVGWQLTQGRRPPELVAVVLSAPPLKVEMTLAMRVKVTAGRLLNKIVPTLLMSNELDPAHISSIPAEVERYLADPLVHDRLSVRLGLSILRGGEKLLEDAAMITLPVLLVQGVEDGIATVGGTRDFYDRLGSEDKRLIELPGLRHEVHHEASDRVAALLADVRNWVQERAAGA
jgi:alpha-beta hydrolase superfamily lysophospholipase